MNKKHKSKRERRKARSHQGRPHDDRRGDVVTVAWMLSTVACATAGGISALGIWMTRNAESDELRRGLIGTLTPLMLFTAAITGLIVVCLTPLVYIFRRTPPPMVITIGALTIALLPLIALVVLA